VNTGVSQKYTWAITAPSEGVGLGRHIEESVQNSTGENLDPYGSRGGNDTVDVRGKYTEITWSSAAGDVSQDGLLMKCLVMEMLTLRQDTET
jgi:hypothetical protein